jgi:decaprenylphospho-beta-D-erythro-pentofuranosid-2-ulose 2-reductase
MPTVLILGATSDIAKAIAKKFASEKYDVQLAARNPVQLAPLESDLKIRYDVNVSSHVFDATDFISHRSFFNGLLPAPDVTVYVAGYMTENEKAVLDLEETLRTINTNYTGAVSILNIAATTYAARNAGTIVGISSVAGLRGRQSNYIYGSAKAGFTAFLSGLRNRMYHHNVHVMTVLPGFVYTRMTENLALPAILTAQPDDVGKAVFRGVKNKRNIIYVKWFWRWIMLIITSLPESIFKKKKL